MPRPSRLKIGDRFGKLVVKELPNYSIKCFCDCDCGKVFEVNKQALLRGLAVHCGCSPRWHTGRTHGHSAGGKQTTEYMIWKAMLERCRNPHNHNYHRYGGRGITVCKRWLKFENFLSDMGPRPAGKSLDRKKNHLGYTPGNCKWSTQREQMRNTRSNRMLTAFGKTQPMVVWAEQLGMNGDAIYDRLRDGWSVERAVSQPRRGSK
jgi:hypothetical protein